MSIKSGIFSVITGIVLILLLGNSAVRDNLPDSGIALTSQEIHGFFSWSFGDVSGTFETAQIVALLVFLVAVFVLGGIAGRARPLAAFVGGWGAAIGAGAISSIAFALVLGDDSFVGGPDADLLDRAFLTAGDGAAVMVVLGWLFGIAVVLGSFGKGQPKVPATPAASGAAPPPPGPTPGYGPDPQWNPAGSPPPVAAPAPAPAPPPPPATPAPAPVAPAPVAPAPAAPAAPDLAKPTPPPAPPQIGPPPDRTQVYGHPPPQ